MLEIAHLLQCSLRPELDLSYVTQRNPQNPKGRAESNVLTTKGA